MSKHKPLTGDQLREARESSEFGQRISEDGRMVKCPTCEKPHGLFYRIGANGGKTLLYTCDRQEYYWWETPLIRGGEPTEKMKHVTKTLVAPAQIMGLNIPEQWTHGRRRAFHKKHQQQLL